MSVYAVSKRGKRPQNEDKHNIVLNIKNEDKTIQPINFYSIYDGHGGKAISTYLSQRFPDYFTKKTVSYPLTGKYISSTYKNSRLGLPLPHTMTSGRLLIFAS